MTRAPYQLQALLPVLLAVQSLQAQPAPPDQPLPFSHKTHAGALKLACKMCHVNPDPGEMMTFTTAAKCMQCHSAVKTDSPHIQKLAAAAKSNREIPWARVYTIPAYVNFSHRAHLETGNTCQECHGPVATRDQLARETDLSMGGCMNCHRAKKASIDCTYCHEQQPQ